MCLTHPILPRNTRVPAGQKGDEVESRGAAAFTPSKMARRARGRVESLGIRREFLMLDAITRVDRWLATHRPDYYAHLRPGVSDAALDAFESRFSLRLPTGFRALYCWRNGQMPGYNEPLQHNRVFYSLEEITERKDTLDGMIGYDFEDPRYWRRGWVPFLHNGGGSHLCVDVAAVDGGVRGQLIAFWKTDGDRPVEAPSVKAWLTALADSMEGGALNLA